MTPFAKTELRTAERADVPAIRRIWRESFGDEDAYIDFFLRDRFVPDDTPVLLSDGRVVSQLFLLPALLRTDEKTVPIDYLFAAATDPLYRKTGCMAKLLDFAATLSAQRGKAAIALLPGNEALYRYYEKHGWQTAFYRRIWCCTREELRALSAPAAPADATGVLTVFYRRQNGVVWDADALRYALSEHRAFRGQYASAGQAFAAESGEEATVLAPPEALGQGAALLLRLTDAPHLTVTLPPNAPFGTRQSGGMIRFLREPFPIHDAFLSFAME